MLQLAVSRGFDAEQLKTLAEIKRDWDKDNARKAFAAAMNAFRAESIEILKTKSVYHGTGPSAKFMYKHALLADIVATVAPKLTAHGLSHRWETHQEGAAITVKCVLAHELGHSIENSLSAPPDAGGAKNSVQAIGSTVTYLQRYTFLAITGLAAKDTDSDGSGSAKEPTITDEQVADLESLLDEVGIVGPRRASMLKSWKIDELREILAKNYEAVVKNIEARRK